MYSKNQSARSPETSRKIRIFCSILKKKFFFNQKGMPMSFMLILRANHIKKQYLQGKIIVTGMFFLEMQYFL